MTISVKHLNFFYGTTQALFDINLVAEDGDTVVLLGPSGAGKSTLIRTFNLLEIPQTGELSIANNTFDLSVAKADTKKIRQLRQDVGMVFQQYNLWPHLTVIENLIEAPVKVLGISKEIAKQEAFELLKRLRLEEFGDRYPLHLSGGQQQRVAIARALMMKPQVLLFDEPTAALDPEITAQIVSIIQELQQTGITQIIVTHEVSVAKKVATKVVYMEQGHIIEMGDASRFDHPQTEQFKQYLSHSE
ncbi:amino acid ABC transporter ATP-binding protein (PAAT family) [Bisgaardia hudsonensis]|uniref:Arginine transport ATP-binding protein ArtP n=1 Tax=Bisgaardia hudsonensis TaxID=109472 RepID=A0A4R2N2I6_9PAST|nr:arginine ABC transporter ATP-binding protein ArtP [Bisgaardia hudsonensis]QLB12487.1 arginine ABC transporter ATP-binding protein ArtP [Bisgaardia hudsonensis]TCP14025.1 amino acid ABC transporter ATP-binding protein (PAAT family) [Bisgaardia hudsonensis]